MQREGTAGDEANPERKRRRKRGFDDLPAREYETVFVRTCVRAVSGCTAGDANMK
jgi:hypothetical protein